MSQHLPSADDSDEALARQTRGPHAQEALGFLYQRHARALLAFLASRVHRNDLDDVAQEVWLRVLAKAAEQFRGNAFRTWLFAIAQHYVIDQSRRKRPEVGKEIPEPPDPRTQPPIEVLIDQERRQQLEECLKRLPREQAEVFRGRCGNEEFEEIGKRLKLPVQQLYALLHKAKAALKTCMERKKKQ